jgi:protein AFG1
MVRKGQLAPDSSQLAAARTLHLLQAVLAARLAAAGPAPAQPGRGAADGGGGAAAAPPAAGAATPAAAAPAGGPAPAVQGAYLWGPIGSGKTLLMDLFARTLPRGARVRREHLHGLLAHVHERSHQLQEALPKVVVKSRLGLPVYRWGSARGGAAGRRGGGVSSGGGGGARRRQ